jgi:hypothetical protein
MNNTDRKARTAEHPPEEDWLDLARDLARGPARARLQQHLDAGCPRCTQSVRLWREVLSAAAEDVSFAPPEHAVRQARATFALHGPRPLGRRIAARLALVFDSFRQPLVAGVRASGAALARHLLYKAGRYTIKLRLEPTEAERVSIAGQILDEHEPAGALQDIAVLAMRGGKTVDRTLTNHLGEFLLQPDAAENLRLCVGVAEIGTFTVTPDEGTEKVLSSSHSRALAPPGRRRRARQR